MDACKTKVCCDFGSRRIESVEKKGEKSSFVVGT